MIDDKVIVRCLDFAWGIMGVLGLLYLFKEMWP